MIVVRGVDDCFDVDCGVLDFGVSGYGGLIICV